MDERKEFMQELYKMPGYGDQKPSERYWYCNECDNEKSGFTVFVKVNGKVKDFVVCNECGEELEERWT